jgi:Asp-tRNA(Asn)/Glu-tRNA(Gln) amidotransferase A subunit family amidase
VASLREAGAQIIGKTTTTEFAFTDPTDCRNPHDLNRSPGGSSSGSGAAVAAGVVDIALGTQTAGSLCRPAAYCGVVGFKPTAGVLATQGVAPLAPSFDTVGIIARDIALAKTAFETMAPDHPRQPEQADICAICGLWEAGTPVEEDWRAALISASEVFESSEVSELAALVDIPTVVAAHRIVMCAEAAAAHGHMLEDARAELLRPKFRAGLEAGLQVSASQLESAKAELGEAKHRFWQSMADVDFVLTLPVPDGAPLLGDTTGFQDWLTPWTVFGGPLLCLPWGVDQRSLPRSVMLAAHPGQDRWLLDVGARLAAKAPRMPTPQLPL